jgi:anthranilate phosphoribosyltransferase
MILSECIEKLISKQNLSKHTCENVAYQLLHDQADPVQIAAFLVLMRAKPESPEELSGIVTGLRSSMISIPTPHRVLDIVGTGGDHANTINISTGSAILAASCGIKIAKHGNRAVTSLAGSADVLEALGINIDMSKEKIAACIDQIGIGFCFAPRFNPGIRQFRPVRKQLSVATLLNLLGPLLNPAHATHYLLGVFNANLLPVIASVLQQTGAGKSMVVHGSGLDEISCAGPTKVIEITEQGTHSTIIHPENFGLPLCKISDLRGGNAHKNAHILQETFAGKNPAIANTFILNTAVSLYLYGLFSSITDAISHARDALYSGAAFALLKKWKEFSHD